MKEKNPQTPPLDCAGCRLRLQDYLDGTLPKQESLRAFLHLRTCSTCQAEYEDMSAVFALLDDLPQHEVPPDFDGRVLTAVPYAAYQAMEPIRRERVPVYLAESFLPRFLRAGATRTAGVAIAALGAVGLAEGWWPGTVATVAFVGVLPEVLVRLQDAGRRLAVAQRRSDS